MDLWGRRHFVHLIERNLALEHAGESCFHPFLREGGGEERLTAEAHCLLIFLAA